MKMDDIVAVLKECSHGVPKFMCRRCSPKSAPEYVQEVERKKVKRYRLSPDRARELITGGD